MPIEFACESCARLLRAPDGSGGKACECPTCGALLDVPDPDAIGMVEVAPANSQRTSTSNRRDHSKVTVACPRCGTHLKCSRSLLGTKGQCRGCHYIFTITTDPQPTSGLSHDVTTNWVFNCPECDQLFEGKPEMRGRKGKCHNCGKVFVIELREADTTDVSPLADSDSSSPESPSAPDPRLQQSQSEPGQTVQQSAEGASGAKRPTTNRQPTGNQGRSRRTQANRGSRHVSGQADIARGAGEAAFPTEPAPLVDYSLMPEDFSWNDYGDVAEQSRTNPYGVAATQPYLGSVPSNRLPSGKSPTSYIVVGVSFILFACIIALVAIGRFILMLIGLADYLETTEGQGRLFFETIATIMVGIIAVLYVTGGISFIRRRNIGAAKAGAVVACIPCLCLINVPFGIWACTIAFNPKCARDFSD